MHLANFCFPDEQFEAGLAAVAADILANSWYSNQVNKRALLESNGLTLHDAHALNLFKNEGLAPGRRSAGGTLLQGPGRPAADQRACGGCGLDNRAGAAASCGSFHHPPPSATSSPAVSCSCCTCALTSPSRAWA